MPWTRPVEHTGVAVRTLQRWQLGLRRVSSREHLAAIRDRSALPPNWQLL